MLPSTQVYYPIVEEHADTMSHQRRQGVLGDSPRVYGHPSVDSSDFTLEQVEWLSAGEALCQAKREVEGVVVWGEWDLDWLVFCKYFRSPAELVRAVM